MTEEWVAERQWTLLALPFWGDVLQVIDPKRTLKEVLLSIQNDKSFFNKSNHYIHRARNTRTGQVIIL